MNKKRKVGENWFSLAFSARNRMMAEHARSGMGFAGKVSQLISVGLGFDDWEWGVDPMGSQSAVPERDRLIACGSTRLAPATASSARFYTSYVLSPSEMLDQCLGSMS